MKPMPLSRRTCLKSMAVTGLCGFSDLSAPGDEPKRRSGIPLSFSLYGMKTLKVAEALENCARIGYDGVELVASRDWPTDPAKLDAAQRSELAKRLADTGLSLHGLMENLSEPADESIHRSNLERLKAAAALGHDLSPATPPVIETILGGKPAQWDEVKGRLVERLRAWADVAASSKTIVAVKPHVAQALHTPAGAQWLMEQINSPWLRLAFDYSHFMLHGLPMAETIATLVPQSRFIHVKDARGKPDKFEFLLPGESDIDYVAYFQAVQKAGYRGPVVVEVSSQISSRPGYDPIAAARRSFENLDPARKKAGVTP